MERRLGDVAAQQNLLANDYQEQLAHLTSHRRSVHQRRWRARCFYGFDPKRQPDVDPGAQETHREERSRPRSRPRGRHLWPVASMTFARFLLSPRYYP